MKESFWGYFVIAFGVVIVIIMLFINRMTTTTEEDFYLVREIMQSSMIDAVDYGTFRSTGRFVMSEQKFVEVFLRRFAESVTNNKTYQISFYDIHEEPPKATVRVRTSAGVTLKTETFDLNLDTIQSGILETIYGINNVGGYEPTPTPVLTPDLGYTISFNKNCTGATGGQSESVIAEYGKTLPSISKTPPVCNGYKFEGWSNSNNYSSGELYYNSNGVAVKNSYDLKNSITLYGRWSVIKNYTISFDKNCTGATGGQGDSITVQYGKPLPSINKTAPKCSGYVFSGWSNSSNYNSGEIYYDSKGNAAKSNYDVEKSITLYGRWVKKGKSYSCDSKEHKLSGTICQYDPSFTYTCSALADMNPLTKEVACGGSCPSGYDVESTCKQSYKCDSTEHSLSGTTCSYPATEEAINRKVNCSTSCASNEITSSDCGYNCDSTDHRLSGSTCSYPATEKASNREVKCNIPCTSDEYISRDCGYSCDSNKHSLSGSTCSYPATEEAVNRKVNCSTSCASDEIMSGDCEYKCDSASHTLSGTTCSYTPTINKVNNTSGCDQKCNTAAGYYESSSTCKYECNSKSHTLSGSTCSYTASKEEVDSYLENCSSKCKSGYSETDCVEQETGKYKVVYKLCNCTYVHRPGNEMGYYEEPCTISSTKVTKTEDKCPSSISTCNVKNSGQFIKQCTEETKKVKACRKYEYTCPNGTTPKGTKCEYTAKQTGVRTCTKAENVCPKGKYNSSTGRCEYIATKSGLRTCTKSKYSCSKGTLNGAKCEYTVSKSGTRICTKDTYSCSKGTLKGIKCEYTATKSGTKTCTKSAYSCFKGTLKGTKCEYTATKETKGKIVCNKKDYTCKNVGGELCGISKCCKYNQTSCNGWVSSNPTPVCSKGSYNVSTKKCEYTANVK